MKQEPVDFKADMLKKEVRQLEAAREGIAKRVWWLAGAAFVGLCGTTRAFGDAEPAYEFRQTFGEAGANGALLLLLIGGVWFLADFVGRRKIAARIPAAYAELTQRGYDFDYRTEAWVWRAPKEPSEQAEQ